MGIQLGVPIQLQGAINALFLCACVFLKPLIAASADAFPAFRKIIFLLLLVAMVVSFTAIGLLKPFRAPEVYLEGAGASGTNSTEAAEIFHEGRRSELNATDRHFIISELSYEGKYVYIFVFSATMYVGLLEFFLYRYFFGRFSDFFLHLPKNIYKIISYH